MRNKHLLSLVIAAALLMITATGYSQNVGIGESTPVSKLDVKGNLTVGADYSGTAAPTNGAIIEGNVGIGNSLPSALLTIGTSSPVTVDNSGNVKISSLASGSIVVTGTGGLLQLVSAPETSNTYLQWTGAAYTWASASASLANLTAGTGLSGSAYNGSAAQTWSVSYGSASGTAVQGNTQITVSPGTGMSGGGTITLGSGGSVTLTNTGVLSTSVTSPIVNNGTSTAPNISLGTIGVANGGTGQTTYTVGDILYASTASALSKLSDVATGNVLISGGTSTAPSWGKVALASAISGTLPIANGGTDLATTPTNGQLLIGNGTNYTLGTITAGTGINVTNASGSITVANTGVTSVGLALPNIFTVSNSPVTTTGTLTGTLASETANTIFAAPNGSAGTPTFRALVNADLPSSGVTAGTYNNVTVNSQGVATGGSNISYLTALPYTEYDATLTQSGTSAPTATVVYNNTGGTITWTRSSTGTYKATISGATFTTGSTVALISNNYTSSTLGINTTALTSTTVITINSLTYSSFNMSLTDGVLNNTSIKIQIF